MANRGIFRPATEFTFSLFRPNVNSVPSSTVPSRIVSSSTVSSSTTVVEENPPISIEDTTVEGTTDVEEKMSIAELRKLAYRLQIPTNKSNSDEYERKHILSCLAYLRKNYKQPENIKVGPCHLPSAEEKCDETLAGLEDLSKISEEQMVCIPYKTGTGTKNLCLTANEAQGILALGKHPYTREKLTREQRKILQASTPYPNIDPFDFDEELNNYFCVTTKPSETGDQNILREKIELLHQLLQQGNPQNIDLIISVHQFFDRVKSAEYLNYLTMAIRDSHSDFTKVSNLNKTNSLEAINYIILWLKAIDNRDRRVNNLSPTETTDEIITRHLYLLEIMKDIYIMSEHNFKTVDELNRFYRSTPATERAILNYPFSATYNQNPYHVMLINIVLNNVHEMAFTSSNEQFFDSYYTLLSNTQDVQLLIRKYLHTLVIDGQCEQALIKLSDLHRRKRLFLFGFKHFVFQNVKSNYALEQIFNIMSDRRDHRESVNSITLRQFNIASPRNEFNLNYILNKIFPLDSDRSVNKLLLQDIRIQSPQSEFLLAARYNIKQAEVNNINIGSAITIKNIDRIHIHECPIITQVKIFNVLSLIVSNEVNLHKLEITNDILYENMYQLHLENPNKQNQIISTIPFNGQLNGVDKINEINLAYPYSISSFNSSKYITSTNLNLNLLPYSGAFDTDTLIKPFKLLFNQNSYITITCTVQTKIIINQLEGYLLTIKPDCTTIPSNSIDSTLNIDFKSIYPPWQIKIDPISNNDIPKLINITIYNELSRALFVFVPEILVSALRFNLGAKHTIRDLEFDIDRTSSFFNPSNKTRVLYNFNTGENYTEHYDRMLDRPAPVIYYSPENKINTIMVNPK